MPETCQSFTDVPVEGSRSGAKKAPPPARG